MRIVCFLSMAVFFSCNSPKQEEKAIIDQPSVMDTAVVDTVKNKTSKLFTAATAEYIKEFYKKEKPDTLFLSRNPEFPDISLPERIEGVPIRIIVTEEGHQLAKRRALTILNPVDLGGGEFMIVTFKDGFTPQFNSQLYFTYKNSEFKLDSLKTSYPYEKTRKK